MFPRFVFALFILMTCTSCSIFFNSYKSKIDGVYIPKHLEDALDVLDEEISDSLKAEIQKMTEDDFVAESHFGGGLSMRNDWKLWRRSRLARYFKRKGIFHPDDMSGIILTSYYRRLVGKEIMLKEQIASYQDYWKGSDVPALPPKREHPEPDLQFGHIIHYDRVAKDETWARVYIQTYPEGEQYWIYDYYYGWKQISAETQKRLIRKGAADDLETFLDEIFN